MRSRSTTDAGLPRHRGSGRDSIGTQSLAGGEPVTVVPPPAGDAQPARIAGGRRGLRGLGKDQHADQSVAANGEDARMSAPTDPGKWWPYPAIIGDSCFTCAAVLRPVADARKSRRTHEWPRRSRDVAPALDASRDPRLRVRITSTPTTARAGATSASTRAIAGTFGPPR